MNIKAIILLALILAILVIVMPLFLLGWQITGNWNHLVTLWKVGGILAALLLGVFVFTEYSARDDE